MAVEWRKVDMKNKGFTLIEVMIALVIFSIGIMSIIGMLMIGEKGIASGDKSFTAVQAAKGQMELLRSSIPPDTSGDVCSTSTLPAIQCAWSVREGVPAEGLSTLEVIATWREGEKERSLVLTTIQFDNNN